jgi:hypothetical protein
MPSTEKVTEKCENDPIRNLTIFNVACSLSRACPQFHPTSQGWGYGPLEMCPCDHRGTVQALVWQIVKGKMGVGGTPKH